MLTYKRLAAAVSMVALAFISLTSTSLVSSAGAAEGSGNLRSDWDNMLHFIEIARPKLAASHAEVLLRDATGAQMYIFYVKTRGADAILRRGDGLEGMAKRIKEVRAKIEAGYVEARADAREIERMIGKLGGSLRAYANASKNLKASGEYALPQLLAKLTEKDTSLIVVQRTAELLPRAGKVMVRGLAEALESKDPTIVKYVAAALGRIQYPHALGQLKELYDTTKLPAIRRSAAAAMISCNGGNRNILKAAASDLYYDLALKYYYRKDSIMPDTRFNTANVWFYEGGLLKYKPVPVEIFCDIYAMRMARNALRLDPNHGDAVSLWLASYLRRELDLPTGATDPMLPEEQADAADYIRAAGAKYAQEVIARGLKDQDSGLVIGTIKAMRDVAGAKNLVRTIRRGAAQPLVQAATVTDRRVRYLAAEVLALALPTENYNGSQVVMSVLSDAVRQTGVKRLLVVSVPGEAFNSVADALMKTGYQVVRQADPMLALGELRKVGGVDGVVVLESQKIIQTVRLLRQDPSLGNLPVVGLGSGVDQRKLAKTDKHVVLQGPGTKAEKVAKAVSEAERLAPGKPLSKEEARDWSVRAANAIRLLGLTGSTVYDISVARPGLIKALSDKRHDVRVAAARALAVMSDTAESQRAIADTASDIKVANATRVAIYKALSESVRRNGNQLTERQSQAIVAVVTSKSNKEVRQAAAQALGALSLSSDLVKPLIINAGNID